MTDSKCNTASIHSARLRRPWEADKGSVVVHVQRGYLKHPVVTPKSDTGPTTIPPGFRYVTPDTFRHYGDLLVLLKCWQPIVG
jgi:hypothetical protein